MLRMTLPAENAPPADVCLLLRAHAEARWLSRELVPLIRELEQDRPGNDEHDPDSSAAVAYLDALAIEARHHAAETEAARDELDALTPNGHHELRENARRYHAAVRRLRLALDGRLEPLLADAGDTAREEGPEGTRMRQPGRTHGTPLRRRVRRRA
jgi:hypothetical protein